MSSRPLQVQGDAILTKPTPNRGIPTGYLTQLESRLAETERALFLIMSGDSAGGCDLDEIHPPRAPSPSAASVQSKSDRMQEWDRFPLHTRGDIQAWFAAQRELATSKRTDAPDSRSPIMEAESEPAPTLLGTPVGPTGTVVGQAPHRQGGVGVSQVGAVSTVGNERPDSKALALSRKQGALYF
jgi:hypothetical protein